MEEFLTRQIKVYKIRCKATWDDDGSGCYGTGPIGYDHNEACKNAVLEGWQIIQQENCWACPAHVRGKENAEAAEDQSQH